MRARVVLAMVVAAAPFLPLISRSRSIGNGLQSNWHINDIVRALSYVRAAICRSDLAVAKGAFGVDPTTPATAHALVPVEFPHNKIFNLR